VEGPARRPGQVAGEREIAQPREQVGQGDADRQPSNGGGT
jgi:hypothetical protein